jgi:serine/threonine protein kinase
LGLNDFEVVGKPLGRGSVGSVHKVVRKDTGEVFAMKVMSKERILDFNLGENVEREISTQQKARHPSILRLYEHFEDHEGIHLLLEYAPNGSLLDMLRDQWKAAVASSEERRGLPETRSAGIFRDVAGALHSLHCSCVVHRDVKPENVLICAGGVAKLADFGWCSQLASGADRGTFCGTSEYLSPEMIASEPYDFKVDVWAAGVLLFETLVGRSPFAASNYAQVLIKISKAVYEFPNHVSRSARDLVDGLLVKEPSRRLCLGKVAEHPWLREHISLEQARPVWGSSSHRSSSSGLANSCHGKCEGAPHVKEEAHTMPRRAFEASNAAPDIQVVYEATARTIQVVYGARASRAGHSSALAEAAPRPELRVDSSDCSARAQLFAPSVRTSAGRGSGFSGASELSESSWSSCWSTSSCDRSSRAGVPSPAGPGTGESLAMWETQVSLTSMGGACMDDVLGKHSPASVAICSARTSPSLPIEQHGEIMTVTWPRDFPRDRSAPSPPGITPASGGTWPPRAREEDMVQVAEDDCPEGPRSVCTVRSAPGSGSPVGSGIRGRLRLAMRQTMTDAQIWA